MGLFDGLFGGVTSRRKHWTEDLEDYTEESPDSHWTVIPDPDNTDQDNEWEEEQEKDYGDSWGEY